MATNDLTRLNTLFDGLIQQLGPTGQRQLARDISRKLRASQAQRIKQNIAPDGSPHTPRQPQLRQKKGRIKRRPMFQKLIRTRWLKATANPSAATIGFNGFANQVAREHHYGLRSRLNQWQEVQMPQRELLGFTAADEQLIEDAIMQHINL